MAMGKDIKSAFPSTTRDVLVPIITPEDPTLSKWVYHFMSPKEVEIMWDGRVRGKNTIPDGLPQGSPISPALFTILMSAVVKRAEQILPFPVQIFSYIDDVNVFFSEPKKKSRERKIQEVDSALDRAADEFNLTWDPSKSWRDKGLVLGTLIGVGVGKREKKDHLGQRITKGLAVLHSAARQNLPLESRRVIALGQILPTMLWGWVNYHKSNWFRRGSEADLAWNRVLRWVAGTPKTASADACVDILGINRIHEAVCRRMVSAAAKWFSKRILPEATEWVTKVLQRWEPGFRSLWFPTSWNKIPRFVDMTAVSECIPTVYSDGSFQLN